MMLAATGSSAEERMEPVHQVGFDVIEGDPSCDGRHERLIRAKLDIEYPLEVAARERICQIDTRKGGEVFSQEIPCGKSNDSEAVADLDFQLSDKIAMTGTLEVCQGIWTTDIRLPRGDLKGTVGGVAFDPMSLVKYASWFRPTYGSQDYGTVELIIDCDSSVLGQQFPSFEATVFIQLNERDDATCSTEDCPEAAEISYRSVDALWEQMRLNASCVAIAEGIKP